MCGVWPAECSIGPYQVGMKRELKGKEGGREGMREGMSEGVSE